MRYSKEFVGKPVYSLDEGRHLGTVRDLYVDRALAWLAGVHLGREGLLSRKSLLIAREAIVVFGLDAVLAQRSDVVTDSRQAPETEQWMRLDELAGRHVDTPAGTRIGTIGDILLDDEARIIGFSLSRVHMEGPIAEHPVVPREALIDTGNEDGVMTIDLAIAEKYSLQALGRPEEAAEAEAAELDVTPTELESDATAETASPAADTGLSAEPGGEAEEAAAGSDLADPAGAGKDIASEEEPGVRAERIVKLPRLGRHRDELDEDA
jgi:uncharacterized protein YrrD